MQSSFAALLEQTIRKYQNRAIETAQVDPLARCHVAECRAVKIRDIIDALEAHGWVQVAQVGSHRQFKHPSRLGRVTVAGHPSVEMHPKTLRSIERQSGVKLR